MVALDPSFLRVEVARTGTLWEWAVTRDVGECGTEVCAFSLFPRLTERAARRRANRVMRHVSRQPRPVYVEFRP